MRRSILAEPVYLPRREILMDFYYATTHYGSKDCPERSY